MSSESPITPSPDATPARDAAKLLSPEDRHRVLVEWNRTGSAFPIDASLHSYFEARAAATPDAEALVVGHERLTYRELNARANRIAHRLRALGVQPETLVGVFLPRTVDLICALLGVLKSGGAYVPLDPHYPPDRLSFILGDARPHAVLTHASLSNRLHEITAADSAARAPAVVCLDTDEPLSVAPSENPSPAAAPNNLAYVIYTSGSTGRPKGVCIEHRNAVAFIHWCGQIYGPDELRGVASTATVCFDASVFEVFTPLSHGGKLILSENALTVPDLPAAHEIHVLDTVPSAIRELLRAGTLPTSVETVNLGGEPVPEDLVRALYALPHIKRVYDQYGPTETTVTATFALRDPDEPATIGRPITNTTAYLLNDALQPVALGEPGELCIGGAGVARGYLNRPDLTAEKFIPDPFSSKPGARLYRTGDVCRFLPDGRLRYLGRADQQVKIRGFRIELGEIESVMSSSPAVDEAVARLWTDPDGGKKLVAYAVPPADSHAPSERELRDFLKTRLPDYMVPSAVVFLEKLPLTPNGKIDPNALPAPPSARPEVDTPYAAPRSSMERTIAGAWSRVLHIDTVGIDDRFMDLGGDSLRLVKLHHELGHATGHKLLITDLFRFPTVRTLAAHLEKPAVGRTSKILARAQRQNAAFRGVKMDASPS